MERISLNEINILGRVNFLGSQIKNSSLIACVGICQQDMYPKHIMQCSMTIFSVFLVLAWVMHLRQHPISCLTLIGKSMLRCSLHLMCHLCTVLHPLMRCSLLNQGGMRDKNICLSRGRLLLKGSIFIWEIPFGITYLLQQPLMMMITYLCLWTLLSLTVNPIVNFCTVVPHNQEEFMM